MAVHDYSTLAALWRRMRGHGAPPGEPSSDEPVLGMTEQGSIVRWPRPTASAAQHSFVTAASGAGKTAMLANALVEELVASPPDPALATSCVVIDGKNDLVHAIVSGLAYRAPDRLSDCTWLAPFEAAGFPFNLCKLDPGQTPLEVRALALSELVAQVSQSQGGGGSGAGARQLDVWMHTLLAALSSPHPAASPLWALDALSEPKHGLKRLAAVTPSVRARTYLANTDLSDELRASCSSRLRTALALTEHLERLASASTCITPAALTAPGKITLVALGSPTGGIEALSRLYGSLIGRIIVEHLFERPSPYRGHHVRIVLDEGQVVAAVLSSYLDALLTRGRSLGLSVSVITQGTTLLHQATETAIPLLMTNAPMKLVGRLAAPDAELLARNLAPRAGIDETVASVRSRFVAQVTNLADRHFIQLRPGSLTKFRSVDIPLDQWDQAAASHADAITTLKTKLALPAGPARVTLQRATESMVFADGGRGRGRPRAANTAPPPSPRPVPDPAPEAPPPRPPRSRWG